MSDELTSSPQVEVENPDQLNLFDTTPDWQEHWKDMPEYNMKSLEAVKQIIVNFKNINDLLKFSELIGQRITSDTISIWFPEVKINKVEHLRWCDES